jgi:hypothetical protein
MEQSTSVFDNGPPYKKLLERMLKIVRRWSLSWSTATIEFNSHFQALCLQDCF